MSSSEPSAPTATQTALSTYELLEQILLHLPIHDLFTLHRISKPWHSLLNRSVPLQERLFLKPTSSPVNPIQSLYNHYSGRTRAIYPPLPLQLNPCGEVAGLYSQSSGRGHRIPLLTFGISDQNLFLQFEIKGIPIYEKRILHERASWRRMFLTQPPVTAVNFEFLRRDPHDGAVTVFNPAGVTWGDLQEMSGMMAREFWEETGRDSESTFESLSFCLLHPFTEDEMEEAW